MSCLYSSSRHKKNLLASREVTHFITDMSESTVDLMMGCDQGISFRSRTLNGAKLIHTIRRDVWIDEGNGVPNPLQLEHEPAAIPENFDLINSIALRFERPIFLSNILNAQAVRLRPAVDTLDHTPANVLNNMAGRNRWNAAGRQ